MMDASTIMAAITGLAGAAGGFFGGRRLSGEQSMGIAVDTVELLQVQVATLTSNREEKDAKIADLSARVEILESLVTQRAEVEVVKKEVLGVRGVVDRIATKVGA
jgi:hypothetical protein